jgi:chorismate dehydratase
VDRKIRVGAVSYLNTKPFIYGLEHGPAKDQIELVVDYPSRLVNMLKTGQIDIGLVPVGALPGLGDYHIVSDYCIGTEGEVASVAVFSEVPMEEIETVYLDYQSRTSVLLCRLLFEKYWKKTVCFKEAGDESYLEQIKGKTAGLIIGDRALMNRSRFQYIYDLGAAWNEMTGLPFIFAVWVSTFELDESFVKDFSEGLKFGVSNFEPVIAENSKNGYDIRKYYTSNISYRLNENMKKSFIHFLNFT